ncbi:acyltransferase [Sphaerisporangium siamense]|uniref:Fucose 4-O-acetylase-like acetyltransferase n=1 Tax=Sphaerisporangium siamense TaxID=795645 RepID=A0A7W7DD23_9ACTN|nr:acyltransferase [Sphaerisporangium siamense]MBB4703173.1 fucose 4-O-acetylase-like acetyltransferase [Sphaerisporangium siamense]GII89193.1 acyltransferase [Sphaerisporangium siamense]
MPAQLAVPPVPPAGPPPPVSRARPGRDLFIDLLRLFGIGMVVLEHWSIPVLSYAGGRVTTGNAFSSPGAFVITWITQVMPLVFFAGGAANAISHRSHVSRGGGDARWLAGRVRRLAWPVLPLAAVWIPLPYLLPAFGLPEQPMLVAARLAGQLLWFLAIYLVAVAATPWLLRLGERFGGRVPAALAVAAVLTDVIRFTGAEAAGYANVAFVWLAVHQLGFLYAQGRLAGFRLMAVGGFVTAAALVAFGPYPGSMIGLPGAISNMAPPTVALLGVAFGQIGLAMLLRPRIVRLAARPRVARVAAWAGPRMMTVYLWHMSALFVVAGVAVVGFGLATPAPASAAWLAGWPLWLAALALVAWPLIRLFARHEEPPAAAGANPGAVRVAAATGLAGAGLLTLTVTGFAPGVAPMLGAAAVLTGVALVTPTRRRAAVSRLPVPAARASGRTAQPSSQTYPANLPVGRSRR